MATKPIDYAKLAQQARQGTPIDYAALADQARQNQPSPQGQVAPQSNASIRPTPRWTAGADFLEGTIKSVGKSAHNTSTMLRRWTGTQPESKADQQMFDKSTQIDTTAGKLGEAAMNTAEFFIPGGAEADALKLLTKAPKAVQMLGKIAIPSLTAGAVGTAQTGSPVEGAKVAAITGGATGVGEILGSVFNAWGKNIQLRKISPRKLDYDAGFDPKVLGSLNLKGDIRDTYSQVSAEIERLGKERAALLSKTRGGSPITVDLDIVFNNVQKKLESQMDAGVHAGENEGIQKAFDQLKNDIYKRLGANNPLVKIKPNVSLEYAEKAKENLGTFGDFVHTISSRGAYVPPEATAKSVVADRIYIELRDAINNSLPKGQVQALNTEMSKLIPIRRAILKQIPVSDRQAAITAMDVWASIPALITGNPAELALLAAVRGNKSLTFGNWLTRIGSQPLETTAKSIGKGLSGLLVGNTSP
jgi:hypothetical protein